MFKWYQESALCCVFFCVGFILSQTFPGRGVTTSSTRLCPTCISAPRKGGTIFPIGSSLGPIGGHVPNLVIRDGVRPLGTPPGLRVGVEGNQGDCLQRKGKGHWVGQAPS